MDLVRMKEIVWGGEELGAKVHLSLLDLLAQKFFLC